MLILHKNEHKETQSTSGNRQVEIKKQLYLLRSYAMLFYPNFKET